MGDCNLIRPTAITTSLRPLTLAADTNNTATFQALLPRYTAIWQQVAVALKDADDRLWFEAFNEPQHFTISSLNAMLAAFVAALRPLHPERLLILGWQNGMGASWIQEGNHTNWDAMVYNASDPNLAVEVHSYGVWTHALLCC